MRIVEEISEISSLIFFSDECSLIFVYSWGISDGQMKTTEKLALINSAF